MSIIGYHTAAVVYLNQVAVTALPAGEYHFTRFGCINWSSLGIGKIDSLMKPAALSKSDVNLPFVGQVSLPLPLDTEAGAAFVPSLQFC